MKLTVGALTLFVADKDRAQEFYTRAFALEPVFEDETSAAFRFENTFVNVVSNPSELIEPAPVGTGATAMWTIFVDDCDATVELLRSRGVDLLNGPLDRP